MTNNDASSRQQNYYPLSKLSMFRDLIDEQLEHEHEQLATLQQVKSKPHILDDAMVARLIKLYGEALELNECYQNQLTRWKESQPTSQQLQEINRIEEQVIQLATCQDKILKLVQSFKGKTIEQVLGKSDLELGLEFLSDLL